MASAWIAIDEVTRRVLEEDSNEDYSSFSDESEREISDHHVSDSSNEEIDEGNEISSDSGDSDAEVYSNDEDSASDRSPLRRPRAGGRNLRCNGRGRARGRGIGRGQARARVGFAAHPQDPPIQWSSNYVAPADRPFTEPSPGPTQCYPADCKEGTIFAEMFTNDMWELLVTETNRYHVQQVAAEPNKHKRKWSPVTRDEMEAFIGILIYMGIVKLPRMKMYWSTDSLIHQGSVSAIMTQTRFFQIWRYFHLADNSRALPREDPGFDKIYRVRQFLDFVLRNAQRLYRLDREVSIDETMVPHKGRLSFKQYIKNKPVRWGIKLWVLCEAKTGYVFNFQVYLGKENGQAEQHLARRVVKHLILPIENKYHHLYMDNFYCDPHLFLQLDRKKMLACGTVRANRKGFPKDIVLTSAMEKRMNRGDYIWRCHENLVAMAWYDRRSVYLISTIHPPESIGEPTTVQRRSAGGARQPIPCPPAQCAYGLEVCLLNAFTILKKVRQTPQDFLTFRIAIVRHLLEGKCFRARPGRPPTRPASDMDARRLNRQYHAISVEQPRRDCVVCAKVVSVQKLNRNFKYKTNIVCVTCDRKPLCLHSKRNCWEKWHSLVEYWR